jgi:hypothetical protein
VYRSEPELLHDYSELLEGDEYNIVSVVRALDAGYSLPGLPSQLREWQPRPLPALPLAPPPPSRTARYARRSIVATVSGMIAIGAIIVGVAANGSGVDPTDLGRQQEIVPRPILGGFHHRGPVVSQNGKPVVEFIASMIDEFSATERWSLIKSLRQFGTFHGVTATTSIVCTGYVGSKTDPVACYARSKSPGYATPDLEHATYVSRYVLFEAKDLVNDDTHVVPISGIQRQLFQKYVANSKYMGRAPSTYTNIVWNTARNTYNPPHLPLLSIGGYLQTAAGIAIPGDLVVINGPQPLTYAQIQHSLKTGKVATPVPPSLVPDINGEANIITALICHADGKKPSSVCSRPAIKSILKRVK